MNPGQNDRVFWLGVMESIARPVLSALAARQLKASMPISVGTEARSPYMPL